MNRPQIVLVLLLVLLLVPASAAPSSKPMPANRHMYLETFDHGPGGWSSDRRYALTVWDGVAYCYSPWWVDANHAPPGAGYLHLLLWMHTDRRNYEGKEEVLKLLPYVANRFVDEGYSR